MKNQKFYASQNKIITDSDRNFIRRIAKLPGNKWGAMLLRSGGIWIFPIDTILQMPTEKHGILSQGNDNLITNTIFNSSECRLIGEGILAYKLKSNQEKNKVFIGDRFGQLHEMIFKDGVPVGISR